MRKIITAVTLVLIMIQAAAADDQDPVTSISNTDELEKSYSELIDSLHANDQSTSSLSGGGRSASAAEPPDDTQKLEALRGTWLVSYKINGKSYTDKIVISGDVINKSDYPANIKGIVKSNITEADRPIICYYSASSSVPAEYLCNSIEITILDTSVTNYFYASYSSYNFDLSGNTITRGYFSIDSSLTRAVFALSNQRIFLSGNRLPASSVSPVSCVFNWIESKYSQYYAPVSKDLTYNGNTYRYYTKTDTLLVYNPGYDHVYSGYNYSGEYYYIDLGALTDWTTGIRCD